MNTWIVDDHQVIASALKIFLESSLPEARIQLFHTPEAAAQELSKGVHPDLAIVDLNFSGQLKGCECIKTLRAGSSETRIVVLSMHAEEVYRQQALACGADVYLNKGDSAAQILKAIFDVMGEREGLLENNLSEREREVAQMVSEGLSSKQIADRLFLSPRTVESHRLRLMRKLGVSNAAQLTNAWRRLSALPFSR